MAGGGGGGGGGGEPDYGLQIAPMLDVMFVLMLFFMVMAGTQKKEAELGIDLPADNPGASEATPPAPVYVKVSPEGQVFYNDLPVDTPGSQDLLGLRDRLKRAMEFNNKSPVIVIPADAVKHQRIVDVMNACSESGVLNLSFGSS